MQAQAGSWWNSERFLYKGNKKWGRSEQVGSKGNEVWVTGEVDEWERMAVLAGYCRWTTGWQQVGRLVSTTVEHRSIKAGQEDHKK